MKIKAPSFVKKILAALSNKTNDLRIRIMIFFLLHKNIDNTSLTQKLHALVAHPHHKKNDDVLINQEENSEESSSFLLQYNKRSTGTTTINNEETQENDEFKDEDLTHALFKESKAEMEEEEEDINQAADLFIQRFKRDILLQKQRSLERHQTLLLSNA